MALNALPETGLQLAQAFGWNSSDLRTREVKRGETRLDVARGLVGGQPAALFAAVKARNGFDPLDSAALYAYHTTVEWGVIADDDGLQIFNSRRLTDGNWFTLPRISWKQADRNEDVLQALSRKGILGGAIEKFAAMRSEPTVLLQAVDDRLVERLDKWRDQALRYSTTTDVEGVDDRLQSLYAQLFVLRAVEDRQLEPNVPPVSSILTGSDKINRAAWKRVLKQAKERIGSDLFEQDVAKVIPDFVIAGVVRDLYHPTGLPGGDSLKYDFSWIESDVLGAAYEKYLATVLHPAPVSRQSELFDEPQREVERVSVRKRSGTFYTPKFIHDYLATRTIDEFFRRHADNVPPTVIDFACGSGSFLVAAVNQILKRLSERDPATPWAKQLIQGGHIVGIDIDSKTVAIARLQLWHRLVEEPDSLPLPSLSNVIIQADGLREDTWGPLNKPYDVVLGNPPFLATRHLPERAALEAKFETAKGRYDFSYLFVEQALRILREGGLLGLVVPNRAFINKNATPLRRLLVTRAGLLTLVDFGSTRPFVDASAYIGCIVAERRGEATPAPETVRVLEVKSLDANFLAALLLDADSSSDDLSEPIRAFQATHPTTSDPWTLLSRSDQRARVLIEDFSQRLDTVAGIFQGIRTGSNDLFVLDPKASDGIHLTQIENGLGDTAIVESELLEPVVYGSEVQRYQRVTPTRKILYTYRRNTAVPEAALEDRYPKTWQYLQRYRALLTARASVTGGTKWYELIRSRDEAWLRKPKLLIRDLAPRTAFALDESGKTFLVGGTAIVPDQSEMLLPLIAYLNSTPIDSFIRKTTPHFRGSFQKFEPQHLQGLPVIDRLISDAAFSEQLTELAIAILDEKSDSFQAEQHETSIDNLIKEAASARGIELGD